MKLTWCHNRLAIGSTSLESGAHILSAEETAKVLEGAGVTHLINCRRDSGHVKLLEVLNGVVVLHNPIEDDGLPKPADWFSRSIDFALHALANPLHKVVVCCYHGNNRSPSTTLAILMAQGLSYEAAMNMVCKVRPGCHMRYGFYAIAAVKELRYT